jgi:ribosomal protein L40E
MFVQTLVKRIISILGISWLCPKCNATNSDNAEACHVCGYHPK